MTTIVEFLEARYSEIEAAARGADRLSEAEHWTIPEPRDYYDGMQLRDRGDIGPLRISWNHHSDEDPDTASDVDNLCQHLVLNDPKAVLADIAAKRAILDLDLPPVSCEQTHLEDVYHPDGHGPHPVYRIMAAAFDQHPDYDETWRPT